MQFKNGHIATKNFDSSNVYDKEEVDAKSVGNISDSETVDLALGDETGNDIVQFAAGHIRTKNFDSSNMYDKTETLLSNDMRNYTFKDVGLGFEFQHVQDAINSCTDASFLNQYMIRIHDDIFINDITQLKLTYYPSASMTELMLYNQVCSYIIMKDYVNIEGANGRQVKIEVNIPTSQLVDSNGTSRVGYVHCCYAYGTFIMKDIYFKCTNTRYCVHQENGSGDMAGRDSNRHKQYINIIAEFMSSPNNSYSNAFGVGLAPNLRVYMENCRLFSHVNGGINMLHTHPNYEYPCQYYIKNCIIEGLNGKGFNQGFQDLCSGKRHKIVIEGCEMSSWNNNLGVYGEFDVNDECHDIRNSGVILSGHSNKACMGIERKHVLTFSSLTENDIDIDSNSSAYAAIFGSVYKQYNKITTGVEYILDSIVYPYLGIGARLGNCSVNNKTLSVNVGVQNISFVFDKDYSSMRNSAILAEMAATISTSGLDLIVSDSFLEKRAFFTDEVIYVKNTGTDIISIDDAVVCSSTGVIKQSDTTKIIGIAAERINPNEYGYIIKRGKQRFNLFRNVNYVFGSYYKVNNNTVQLSDISNADFICTYADGTNSILDWCN